MSGSPAALHVLGRSSRASARGNAQRVTFFTGAVLAALTVAFCSGSADAQQFKEINEYVKAEGGQTEDLSTFKPDHPRKMNQLQGQMLQVITVGKITGPVDAANIEKLAWIHVAELTWPSADPKESYEQRRYRTKTRFLQRPLGTQDDGQVLEIHDRANAVLLKGLPALIASNEYSLQSRFNAMILLGQLDKIEPDANKGRAAVPMAEVTPLLLKAFQTPELGEPLRMAALIGIERHCGLQVSTADKVAIAGELLKLLNEKAPPAGFSFDGFHWARKLALQSVASLAAPGAPEVNKSEFVAAIHQIIADEKQPLFLRREACAALGALTPATLAAGPIKAGDLVKGLANFTLAVSKAGGPRIDPNAPLDLSKAEDILPTPVEGPGFNMPGTPQLQQSTPPKKLFAEGVTYYLHSISLAIGGRDPTHGVLRMGGIDENSRASADSLLKDHVNPMLAAMNRPSNQLAAGRLASDLQAARSKLEQWMQGRAMIAAPGGAAPAGNPTPVAPAPVTPVGGGGAAAPAPGAGGALGAPVTPAAR
jgi:hypothetical protein